MRKRVLMAIIFFVVASCLSGETVVASNSFEFSGIKNADDPTEWDYSVNIYPGSNISGETLPQRTVLETFPSSATDIFTIVYSTDSFYTPVKITVSLSDFVNQNGTTVEVNPAITVSGPKYYNTDSDSQVWSYKGYIYDFSATENDFSEKYGNSVRSFYGNPSTSGNGPFSMYFGVPDNSGLRGRISFTDEVGGLFATYKHTFYARAVFTATCSIIVPGSSASYEDGEYVMNVAITVESGT